MRFFGAWPLACRTRPLSPLGTPYTDKDLDEMIAAPERFLDAVEFEKETIQWGLPGPADPKPVAFQTSLPLRRSRSIRKLSVAGEKRSRKLPVQRPSRRPHQRTRDHRPWPRLAVCQRSTTIPPLTENLEFDFR
jgi:hypothetical protein